MENPNEDHQNADPSGASATIHSPLAVQSIQKLFERTEEADVHFVFESEPPGKSVRLPAHRNILAMASPVFETMFYGSIPEVGDIKVLDSSVAAFKQFLSTFYCSEVTVTAEHVGKVMYLATKYLVVGCLEICDKFLRGLEDWNDIIRGYELAVAFDRNCLKKALEETIGEKPKVVIELRGLVNLPLDVLKEFVQIDGLKSKAKEIFDVCMKWAIKACIKSELDPSDMQNRKSKLGECFYWIPFYMIKPEEIAQIAAEYKDLFDRDELIDLLRITASVGPVFSNIFKTNINFETQSIGITEYRGRWSTNFVDDFKWYINEREVAVLDCSLNKLMVAIRLAVISHDDPVESKMLSGTLKITRKDDEGQFSMTQPFEIQCLPLRVFSTHERIKLIRPFQMKPGKIKFVINFDSSWEEAKFYRKQMVNEREHLFQCMYVQNANSTT